MRKIANLWNDLRSTISIIIEILSVAMAEKEERKQALLEEMKETTRRRSEESSVS